MRGDERPRRQTALSMAAIVRVTIAILDAGGESALTFRALAQELETGAGAIYHHVVNKNELLRAAAVALIAGATDAPQDAAAAPQGGQTTSARATILDVFDVIDEHPWLGAQLTRDPWQPAVLLVLEATGERLTSLALADRDRFHVASALVHHLLGAAGQHAASALLPPGVGRRVLLASVADTWVSSAERDQLPFVRAMARQLANHDDRQQFSAGVDLILHGAAGVRRPG